MTTEPSGRFLDEALKVARLVQASARTARDGGTYWCHPAQAAGAPAPASPLGPYLYSGVAGVALFLAATYRLTRDGDCRELCLAALAPMRRELRSVVAEPGLMAPKRALGILSGLGSLIYVLLRVGDLLGDPSFYADADDLSTLITAERIELDDSFDLMLGSAGAILALLALDERVPEPRATASRPLAAALLCAEHLLQERAAFRGGPRAWSAAPGAPPATGMSHGAAGICLALLRLYARTRRADLLAAAAEGWSYERTLFDPSTGEWRRPTAADADFSSSWCNGAPGIGLARLATLDLCDDEAVRQEISQALQSARSLDLGVMDQVCCGNMGRVDVLVYAASRLSRPELAERARALAARVLARAAARGRFTLVRAGESLPDLRFFTGETGIAYSLLRLEHAADIPCILAFE